METTLLYFVVAGVGLVFVFLAVKAAVRWAVRLAIILLLLIAVFGSVAWLGRDYLFTQPGKKPRSVPARPANN